MRLGDEGAVDDQRAVVQAEGGALDLDVARQAGSRQEGVVGSVLATEVSATAVWKVKVPAEMRGRGARPREECGQETRVPQHGLLAYGHLRVGARVLVDKHRWYS